MKIIAVSDTHGSFRAMEKVLKLHKNADIVVHCGDSQSDIEEIKEKYPDHTYVAVKGNCDFYNFYNEIEEFDAEGVHFMATHGHRLDVKWSMDVLINAAKERGAQVAIFGHTHIPYNKYEDGVYLINPGACAGLRATYAVIEVKDGQILTNLAHI